MLQEGQSVPAKRTRHGLLIKQRTEGPAHYLRHLGESPGNTTPSLCRKGRSRHSVLDCAKKGEYFILGRVIGPSSTLHAFARLFAIIQASESLKVGTKACVNTSFAMRMNSLPRTARVGSWLWWDSLFWCFRKPFAPSPIRSIHDVGVTA